MVQYSYNTSHKSYLDILHNGFWQKCAEWIAYYFPSVTPNMVTMAGSFPTIIICILYLLGTVGPIAYLLLFPLLIWYLNMDAIDGKLARHTNRSSPLGQIVDHGIDAFVIGLVTIMIGCSLSIIDLHQIKHYQLIIIFIAVLLSNIVMMLCNITEFFTHRMVVSMGPISTTDIIYFTSFVFLAIYRYQNQMMNNIICGTGILTLIGGIYILRCNLDISSMKLMLKIIPYIICGILCSINVMVNGFGLYEIFMMNLYMSSFIVDIIYSNAMKKNAIWYDYMILIILVIRLKLYLMIDHWIINIVVDFVGMILIIVDKNNKKNTININ